MAMNINTLNIFITVADAGNITRAAEALHMSQPAVSKAIKNLEDELGVALFFRDKRNGIILTDTGERVLSFARQMMLIENKIYQTAYMSRNLLEGTLKIASLPYATTFFLVKALAKFHAKYPRVSVEITEGSTNEVNQMVSKHVAEFGISIIHATEFEYETLMKDRIIAISKQPLDEQFVDLANKKQQFYICSSAWDIVHPILKQNHIKNLERFKIVSDHTVRAIAQEGIGIGLQPDSITLNSTETYYKYPVTPLVEADFILIANKFENLSPAAKAFIATIREKS